MKLVVSKTDFLLGCDRIFRYPHIWPAFDHFWAIWWLTWLALDYFNIFMVFAIEKLKFMLYIRISTHNLTTFWAHSTRLDLSIWYLHWLVLNLFGIHSQRAYFLLCYFNLKWLSCIYYIVFFRSWNKNSQQCY